MFIRNKKMTLHEDWVSVILGFIILTSSILGFKAPAPVYTWNSFSELSHSVFSIENIYKLIIQFLLFVSLGTLAVALIGKPVKNFLRTFPIVYFLTVVALIVAGNTTMKGLNLEAVIFSLTIGLIIGNTFRLPIWLSSALTTEVFVKIGLVLLGSSIIFSDVLKAGFLGLIQALVVVLSVWYFAFWICKKFRIDDELTMMISSAVSICGVSAAIATSGAINGDPKKLSYVISLVLITAIPMMIGMPYIADYMGLSQEVTGAWIGGSIDTSGAVVASGTLVGETALKISTIVKFSQNVLLGIAAFAISIYWTVKKNQAEVVQEAKPTLYVIWERFPKFVLGFLAASLLFSFILSMDTVDSIKGGLKNIQTLWFVLAFTSIGLETNFNDLFKQENKKPLYTFLTAQLFNIFITLILAYFLFR